MSTYHLIVSNPPHVENWNAIKCGAALGLTAAEMRLKGNYGVPEIWVADADAERIQARCAALAENGLSVLAASTEDLARIPDSTPVRELAFTGNGILWGLDGGDFDATADLGVLVVNCRPKQTVEFFRGGPGPIASGRRAGARKAAMWHLGGVAGAVAASITSEAEREKERIASRTPVTSAGIAFLDCYFMKTGALRRITFGQGLNFAGLGEHKRATFNDNLDTLLDLIAQTFAEVRVDPRLIDIQPRQTPVIGVVLPRVLESVTGGRPLPPLELASRLAFLTAIKGGQ
jgi:hypothetical protein